MKGLVGIMVALLVSGCGVVNPTDTEVNAVQKVLDFYGGVCKRGRGFSTDNGETQKYFNLEISQSKSLDGFSDMLELPASNIAYLFYSNLNDEQDNYTYIKVKIKLSNGQSHGYYYLVPELKEVETLTPLFKLTFEKIKVKDYPGLLSHFDEAVASDLTPELLEEFCTPNDSALGVVDTAHFHGFAFFERETDKKSMVVLGGILAREKGNTPLTILIGRESKKMEGFRYEF